MVRRRQACRAAQQGLFQPVSKTLRWRRVPVEAQRDVTKLIARLLREYRDRVQGSADAAVAAEGSDD